MKVWKLHRTGKKSGLVLGASLDTREILVQLPMKLWICYLVARCLIYPIQKEMQNSRTLCSEMTPFYETN